MVMVLLVARGSVQDRFGCIEKVEFEVEAQVDVEVGVGVGAQAER